MPSGHHQSLWQLGCVACVFWMDPLQSPACRKTDPNTKSLEWYHVNLGSQFQLGNRISLWIPPVENCVHYLQTPCTYSCPLTHGLHAGCALTQPLALCGHWSGCRLSSTSWHLWNPAHFGAQEVDGRPLIPFPSHFYLLSRRSASALYIRNLQGDFLNESIPPSSSTGRDPSTGPYQYYILSLWVHKG